MTVKSGAWIKSGVNDTLVNNGLFWIGVTTAVNQTTTDQTEIRSGIGLGPLQRIHLKRNLDVGVSVSSMIPKDVSVDTLGMVNNDAIFSHYQYYLDQLDPSSQIILRQDNKAIMTNYSIDISANSIATGVFNHVVFQPDRITRDLIEEYSDVADIPNGGGNEITPYADGDLPVLVGGQFFPGITNISISSTTDLRPLNSPGGIYGYYFGKPVGLSVSITTYEKDFEINQQLFNEVNSLTDLKVGPFTLKKIKLITHSPGVSAQGYKQVNVDLVATDLTYNPNI